jgi:hypothetical protein
VRIRNETKETPSPEVGLGGSEAVRIRNETKETPSPGVGLGGSEAVRIRNETKETPSPGVGLGGSEAVRIRNETKETPSPAGWRLQSQDIVRLKQEPGHGPFTSVRSPRRLFSSVIPVSGTGPVKC